MHPVKRIVQGYFTTRSLRVYLAVEAMLFWGIIFVCWRQYPEEHAFSILTHTFSYLGSFNDDRNPVAWWLFTVAMTGWGLASIPVVRHISRVVASGLPDPSPWPGRLMVFGCFGIVMVGLFPDARDDLIGSVRWTDLHYFGALFLVLGFLIGVPWNAVLVRRASRNPVLDGASRLAFEGARWPHAVFAAISTVALFFLIRWVFVYERLKEQAEATGVEIGSSWREAMNTPYSFPLWDNVFVYTLFIYLAWTALVLPKTE